MATSRALTVEVGGSRRKSIPLRRLHLSWPAGSGRASRNIGDRREEGHKRRRGARTSARTFLRAHSRP